MSARTGWLSTRPRAVAMWMVRTAHGSASSMLAAC